MASTSDSQRGIAQKTWELSNNILEISPGEEIYKYDKQQQQQMLAAKPWEKDHHFFKDIKVYMNLYYSDIGSRLMRLTGVRGRMLLNYLNAF